MRSVYLSVDLDYWSTLRYVPGCLKFFTRLARLNLDIKLVADHQQMCDHIDASGCQRVINIDLHSDIHSQGRYSPLPLPMHCGNWANFIVARRDGTFEWRYPPPRGQGVQCHEIHTNPFETSRWRQWKYAIEKPGLARLPWKNVTAAGIAISPNYIYKIRPELEAVLTVLGVAWTDGTGINTVLHRKPTMVRLTPFVVDRMRYHAQQSARHVSTGVSFCSREQHVTKEIQRGSRRANQRASYCVT